MNKTLPASGQFEKQQPSLLDKYIKFAGLNLGVAAAV